MSPFQGRPQRSNPQAPLPGCPSRRPSTSTANGSPFLGGPDGRFLLFVPQVLEKAAIFFLRLGPACVVASLRRDRGNALPGLPVCMTVDPGARRAGGAPLQARRLEPSSVRIGP